MVTHFHYFPVMGMRNQQQKKEAQRLNLLSMFFIFISFFFHSEVFHQKRFYFDQGCYRDGKNDWLQKYNVHCLYSFSFYSFIHLSTIRLTIGPDSNAMSIDIANVDA